MAPVFVMGEEQTQRGVDTRKERERERDREVKGVRRPMTEQGRM